MQNTERKTSQVNSVVHEDEQIASQESFRKDSIPNLRFQSQFSSDPITESIIPDKAQLPKQKMASILDMSWISGSEDDKFFNDQIVSTSQKPSVKVSNMRSTNLNSSPTSERVILSQVLQPPPEKCDTSASTHKLITDLQVSASQKEFSDPISSSSVNTSPIKKPAKKVTQKKQDATKNKLWKEANKLRRFKDDVLKEMVCEVAFCLKEKLMTEYFHEQFKLPTVRHTYFEIPLVCWKRRVTADYNAEQDTFVPCELKEISEKVLVLFYEAKELVENVQNGIIEKHMETAHRRAKLEDPLLDYYLVIMVPGFKDYVRKLKTAEDRKYREQIQEQIDGATTKRRKTTEAAKITSTGAQELIMKAEVSLGVNFFFTKTLEESIDWLSSFTYTIGNSLYDKHERNPEFANFGRVKLGTDRKTTFVEMIKKFNLMSHQKAENLYKVYASPVSIYKRFLQHDNLGTVDGKAIVPPTVNSAMRRLFTATDPSQVIND